MGGHYELASLIASQVINAIQATAAAFRGQELEDENYLPIDAFVPHRPRRDGDEIEAAIESLESMVGI